MDAPVKQGGGNAIVQPKLRDDERGGLPGWTYFNPELMELEKEVLFRSHWQLLGHVSDIPKPGDYLTFDLVGERAIAVRGKDGQVRCFHNVCRHRGSRVVADRQGHCKSAIVCPFHGWAYNLDGTLRGAPAPRSLPALDPKVHGLPPLESEIWQGFIFVRFRKGPQPSIATILGRWESVFERYECARVKPLGLHWEVETAANWKAVRDVDNEGYHVPIAHPALYDLYGRNYVDELPGGGLSRAIGRFNPGPGRSWSVRHYRKLRPSPPASLGVDGEAWVYIGIFPNTVFMLYPEQIGYYQEWPVTIERTVQRGNYYGLADARREMKLARYLVNRIDRETAREDTQLIVWSSEAMKSKTFPGIILSDQESGVRHYHDELRAAIPIYGEAEEPVTGSLKAMNSGLAAARQA